MKQKTSAKLRFGAFSVVFTAAVIVAVIVFNVIISAVGTGGRLSVDMTQDDLFSVSDDTIATLGELKQNYTIRFCKPLDELSSDSMGELVYNCAKQFEAKMDNVAVDSLDIFRYPARAEKYKRSVSDTVKSTDVIVENENGQYRKYALQSFFVENEEGTSYYAFNGEFKFASAFLQLAGQYNPVVGFVTGHGESRPSALMTLFEDAGYEVRTVDLRTDEIDPYTKILVVYDPVTDFVGKNDDGVPNEIDILDNYMAKMGNLMVFVDPATGAMPKFEEYLAQWGIEVGKNVTLRDPSSEYATASSPDGRSIIATLPTEGTGASLHKDMRAMSSQPVTVVHDAVPVFQLFTNKNQRAVSSVLTTTKAAVYSEGGEENRGQFDLMTLSRETIYRDGGTEYSNVLVCGSTDFAADEYMLRQSYGNRDILYAAMKAFNTDLVPIDISYKYFDDTSITISTAQANGWLVAMSVVIPVLILIGGAFVWVRRKHA